MIRCTTCCHENPDGAKFCNACAEPLASGGRQQEPPETAPSLPSSIGAGRYEVKRFLGEGAKKRVYLAHDTKLDRDVAIAALKTERIDETTLARIRLEARAMALLGDHPRIVTVFDIGEEDERPYIVSQYMAGGTLESLLTKAENHRLALDQALRIADQVCQALEHAHARGIVHRDLKPGNVWLTDDGFAKLGDFGLAVSADRSTLTQEGAMLGTVAYMPPEQALGKPVDARSDLYALGCLLYEIAAGQPPFTGDAIAVVSQHLHAAPAPPSSHAAIPTSLDALILKLLLKKPEERPESATAVRQALRNIGPGTAVVAQSIEPPPGVPFVGRTEELGRLRAGLEEMIGGRGRLAVLAGEPGIGKTRTAEELCVFARSRGVSVFVGRCHDGEGVPAFWPWVQIFRAYINERGADTAEREMGPGAADIAQIVPELRERVRDQPLVSSVDFEANRFRLFDSVTTFLRNASRASPLLLVLDDLHWADKPTLLLLQFLARQMASSRIYLLGAYRDVEVEHGHPLAEVLPTLRREAGFQRILLRGLPEADVDGLLRAIAGHEVPEAFARTITTEGEGNPFFVGEILRNLLEEGILYREGERWRSRVAPEELRVPESVREVVGRRLARLGETCRQVLSVASVIGREFDARRLAAVSEVGGDQLSEALEQAVAANVIFEVPRAIDRYSFSHALIRETLYQELRSAQRIRLHHRLAEALQSSLSDGDDALLAELAHHALEAAAGGRDVDKAIDSACRAAERALGRVAYEEAAALYERVLDLLEPSKANEPRRGELLLALGQARSRAGDEPRSKTAFEQAGEIAKKLGDNLLLAHAALGYAGAEAFGIFDRRVISQLEEALEALDRRSTALRVRLLARLGVEHFLSGVEYERGIALQRQAIDLAREAGDAALLARVLFTVTYSNVGVVGEERLSAAELRRVANEANDRELLHAAELLELIAALERADAAAVEIAMERRGDLAKELRMPHHLGDHEVCRAMQSLLAGRFDEAESRATRALDLLRRSVRWAEQAFGAQLFGIRREQGRLSEIEAMISAMTEQYPHILTWRIALAQVNAEMGRLADTRAQFEVLAKNDFADVPRDMGWMISMTTLAEVAAFLEDRERAAVLYRNLAPDAERAVVVGGAVVWNGPVNRYLGLLATTLRRFDEAEAHFESAIAMSETLRAKPFVARIRHDYARMLLTRDASGDREKALSLVNQSLETAERLGMKSLLERAVSLKAKLHGIDTKDVTTSIDAVTAAVESKRPDLRPVAIDGTVTVLFSDMEGFSSMTERLGDREAHKFIQLHNSIVREALRAHGGLEVELQGDGFLLAFGSARRALRCAVSIQSGFARHSAEHPEQPIRVRIGAHVGEPIKEGERFFGKTLILASRIASQAQGGEILVSALVKDLVESTGDFRFDAGQEVELKGLAGTHDLYEVLWDGREPRRKPSPTLRLAGNVFTREGDYWTVAYDGKSVRLRDMKGMHSIAHLLRHPGEEFHVADLATVGESVPGGKAETTTEVSSSSGLGDAGEVLDPKARSEYRERLESLREELEEAQSFNDSGRVQRLKEEIDFISRELSAAFGIGNRPRKAVDSSERIRKAVASRIRESLARIQREHPELGKHFSHAIRTGIFCSYAPEKAVDWKL